MTKQEKKILDSLWSRLVKLRAKEKCEYCYQATTLNSHHVFSRSSMSVRFDELNGVCLCAKHHCLGNFSAHKAPLEFGDWLRDKRGETWYIALRMRFNTSQKIDYKLTKLYLEKEIKKYE